MSRLVSFLVLLAIILVVGILFYKVLINFFVPLFLAGILTVIFRPIHQWFLVKTGGRAKLAAVLATLVATGVMLTPLPFAVYAAVQGVNLIRENDVQTMRLRIEHVRDMAGLQMPPYNDQIEVVDREIEQLLLQANQLLPWDDEAPGLRRLAQRVRIRLAELKQVVHQYSGPVWDARFENIEELLDRLIEDSDSASLAEPAVDDPTAGNQAAPRSAAQPATIELTPTQVAIEIKEEFTRLRTELLGGGVMAMLRELANPSADDIEAALHGLIAIAQPRLMSLTGSAGAFLFNFIVGFVIIVIATFFFFYDGPAMAQAFMELNPLDDEYERQLLTEFDRISRAVVLATLLSAVAQGVTAGVGYIALGLNYWLLLTLLTIVFAMIPFVGPAMVWVPVVLYVGVYEGRVLSAGAMALWGVLAVGSIDNVVKVYALQGQGGLHPLLALLSVLGGVQTLGPIGIVIGPMVVALLQTLLMILQQELSHFDSTLFDAAKSARGAQRKRRRRSPQEKDRPASGSLQSDDRPGNSATAGASATAEGAAAAERTATSPGGAADQTSSENEPQEDTEAHHDGPDRPPHASEK